MGRGQLRIELRTGESALAVPDARIGVIVNGEEIYTQILVASDAGLTRSFELPAPDAALSLDRYETLQPFSLCDVTIVGPGFYRMRINGVTIFDGEISVVSGELIPLPQSISDPMDAPELVIVIPMHQLNSEIEPRRIERPVLRQSRTSNDVLPAVEILEGVYIPETITVHLGPPDEAADNVTVSFTDYIKNVASSEIYPTWPNQSLRANIIAQISLVLNRVYTEWYPSRGYPFDITNSTATDQYFVFGRNIFENISDLVDEIFNTYITKPGRVEPYFAEYCNGTTSVCAGMSQWGTVSLAENGLLYDDILSFYYGDIVIKTTDRIMSPTESYPGSPLFPGMENENVRLIQEQLNRIAINYPAIPLNPVSGIYDSATSAAVKEFRRLFVLPDSDIVDRQTWYRISSIYTAVKRLAELTSEGQRANYRERAYPGYPIGLNSKGSEVQEIQFYLRQINFFDSLVLGTLIDGIYGAGTQRAVKSFQERYSLPVTGTVDEATWNKLVDVYLGTVDNVDVPVYVSEIREFPGSNVGNGSSGENVLYIQNLLNVINDIFVTIPTIDADGEFGPRTAEAVKEFQRIFALSQTGVVNEGTWNKMNLIYVSVASRCVFANGEATGNRVWPGRIITEGMSGEDVRYIQNKINLINRSVPYVEPVDVDGIYGWLTAQAVSRLQEVFGLPITGNTDETTWYLMNYLAVAIRTGCLPS